MIEILDSESVQREVSVFSFEAKVNGKLQLYHRISAKWLDEPVILDDGGFPISATEQFHLEREIQD